MVINEGLSWFYLEANYLALSLFDSFYNETKVEIAWERSVSEG